MENGTPDQSALPGPLAKLSDLALDLSWTWSHCGDLVWRRLDPDIWERTKNAWFVLQGLSSERLKELAGDAEFLGNVDRLAEERRRKLNSGGWYATAHPGSTMRRAAYFSMEFGLSEALPLYAGGLGILAGDFLKAASDLGAPVVGVGLLYQEGYFRQFIDGSGDQEETYPYNEPISMPIRPVLDEQGMRLRVAVDLPGRRVLLRIWRAEVGRTSLYLLDSNDPLNSPIDRAITAKLYGGGKETRLLQEIVLGIGGWRALEAHGLEIDICHLNEGHAAFVILERARTYAQKSGLSFAEALWATRAGNIFTTHTAVPAGFDLFDEPLLARFLPSAFGLTAGKEQTGHALLTLGRQDDAAVFNMAYLAMRGSSHCNGVSRLHGAVSRHLFQPLFPRWPEREVPVGSITNAVHMPSWDSAISDDLWTRICGKDRWQVPSREPSMQIAGASDEDLWCMRGHQREELIRDLRVRLEQQLRYRGAFVEGGGQTAGLFDPNTLTLGFARRFATYKRPTLLLKDPARLLRILTDPARPVQIAVAGKAHPDDLAGKRLVSEWVAFANRNAARRHVVFIEDYDISVAMALTQGVDVWLNTPRRGWEASGTSGMKVLVNGGLNLSELDGWWAEAFGEDVGWALGDGLADDDDDAAADALYGLLENRVVPCFYERDQHGIPRRWLHMIRSSMATLAPAFNSGRMVQDYVENMYHPAAEAWRRRVADGGSLARELHQWETKLRQNWHQLHIGQTEARCEDGQWQVSIPVHLGEVEPDSVRVEIYAEPDAGGAALAQQLHASEAIPGSRNGFIYIGRVTAIRPIERYCARIVAWHPGAVLPMELPLIYWQR